MNQKIKNNKREKIMNRLQEHYEAAILQGHEIVGLFLQGSQNYDLDYSESDIDTKAIVLPSFQDFCLNKKPVSYTHVMENNEHVDIKDIRLMFENIKKQNINFVEILFTDYYIINPKYKDDFSWLQIFREEVGRYNPIIALNSMCGMQLEKKKALEHPYPTTAWKIEKYGYDPKQLHHIIRMHDFINKYTSGNAYKDCLLASDREHLINVKKGFTYSLTEAREISAKMIEESKIIKDKFLETFALNDKNKLFVDNMFNDVIVKVMKQYYTDEFFKEHN